MKSLKRILRITFGVLLIASVICITACDKDDKGFYFDEKTFTSKWNKWEDKKIENYSFIMEGELPYGNFTRYIPLYKYKVKIVVKNGVMDSFEYIGDIPHDYDGAILEPEYTSISDMFQKISDWAQAHKEWWYENPSPSNLISTVFDMKYDKDLHFITFFEPVSKWKPGTIVDTHAHAVKISEFTILEMQID